MNKSIIAAAIASGFLTACVAPPMYVNQPVQYEAAQDEYIPPVEYVVDAPVYYDSLPGIAFYPMFIDAPGSCHCVVPMRFYRGAWLNVNGEVIHRGHFPYVPASRIGARHLEAWRHSEGIIRGMRPMHGSFQMVGGHARPVPPAGSIHHQEMTGNRVNYDPAAARYSGQNREPLVNEHHTGGQSGHERDQHGQMPVDAAAQRAQPNDLHHAGMQPGHEHGQMPAEVAVPRPQQNDERHAGTQAVHEHGQKPADIAVTKPPVKPLQVEEKPRQHEHNACSDQDKKDGKCK